MGHRMTRNSKGFTQHERDTAIRVLMKSEAVQEWLKGTARAYDVDLDTPEGKRFAEREGRKHAEKLIK